MRLERKNLTVLVGIFLLVFLVYWSAAVSGQAGGDNKNFLPVVLRMPTLTPTQTPTPTITPTPTPTLTPTPTQTTVVTVSPPPPATAPLYSTSYYMKNVNTSESYNLGCQLGQRDLDLAGKQTSLVILHYASPQKKDGVFGAITYNPDPAVTFVPLADIYESARYFGYGYWYCVGSDYESHLSIAVGISNYPSRYYGSVTYEHAVAWSQMVKDLNTWLTVDGNCPRGCDGQVDAMGSIDLELAWNSPSVSANWVNGFGSVNGHRELVNFGALEGCPYFASPGAQCGSYNYLWSKEQVMAVTSQTWIRPMPEIYLTNGVHAQQWYLMSVYSADTRGRPINFYGALTQYQACGQRGGCTGINNTPKAGWKQLNDLVSSNPKTAVGLYFSSDMKWQNEKDVTVPTGSITVPTIPDGNLSVPSPKSLNFTPPAVPQPVPLDTQSEIIEGSEGLVHAWEGDIRNLWKGSHNGAYVRVLAGAAPDDARQGLLIVMTDDPLTGAMSTQTILAPTHDGALRITEGQGGILTLLSQGGTHLSFDLQSQTFMP